MLIGRSGQTARIAAAMAQAAAGRAAALLLVGAPGMGKTALLEWARGRATGFQVVAVTGARPDRTLGWAGLLQVLRALPAELRRLPPGQAGLLRQVCGLGPPGSPPDRLAVQVALLCLLAAAAERRPLLVLVDDAHWLDAESRDALSFAARRLDADPVLLLFAAREQAPAELPPLPVCPVPALDPGSVAALVAAVRGIDPPAGTAARLAEATGGNPLALTELARGLPAAQLRGTEPLPHRLPLASVAEQAYGPRLDALPSGLVTTLALYALAAGEDPDRVLTAGATATDAAALEDAGLLELASGRVRTAHALLAAAVVGRVPPSRRRGLHRALAAAHDGPGGDPARRAWHLAEAADGPDAVVAGALAAVAADRDAAGGYAAAAGAYERSAMLTASAGLRSRRYQDAADAAVLAGYDDWSQRLLALARAQTADPADRARIDHALGVRHIYAGRPRRAEALLLAAADVLAPVDPGLAGAILSDAAFAAFLGDRLPESLAAADRARASSADPAVLLAADVSTGLAGLHLGDPAAAGPLLATADELAAAGTVPAAVVEYVIPLTIALTWAGRHAEAVWTAEAVAAELRARGASGLLPGVHYACAYARLWRGDLARARLHAAAGQDLARETGNRLWQLLTAGALALCAAVAGDRAGCDRWAGEVRARRTEVDLRQPHDIDDALGLAALAAGDTDAALAHLQRANTAGEPGRLVTGRPTMVDLVEACVRAGRPVPDGLAERLAGAVPAGFPAMTADAWRCRGLLGRDDLDIAFGRALTGYAGTGSVWQEARTRLAYGERLRRCGRRVDSRPELARAAALFAEIGTEVWRRRAVAELAAAGGSAPAPDRAGVEGLTVQELAVAMSVADGATNREVSATLFLSPKTVEMHLTRVYRKLGVRSRTELAARLAGRSGAPA
ncbi:MAG TPA: LuxR family transcriptional regulator [Mycobacteriales bacterium]